MSVSILGGLGLNLPSLLGSTQANRIEPGNITVSNITSLPGIEAFADLSINTKNFSFNASALLSPNTAVVDRRLQFMQLLSQWWTTPALPYLWIVKFELPSLLTDSNLAYWNEQLISNGEWGVDNAINNLAAPFDNTANVTGCIFAQGVEIPGEQLDIQYAGPFNRGFRSTPYVNNRLPPYSFAIDILETNVSFVDAILRPWNILVGHYGLVARPEGSITANVEISELCKTGNFAQDIARRKIWQFFGCFPWKISQEKKTYTQDQELSVRNTEWYYTKYQLIQAQ